MAKTLNILHLVQEYVPAVGGMSEVVRRISEGLVRNGHKVTIATSSHPNRKEDVLRNVKIVSFDIKGNAVEGLSGEKEKYEHWLLESEFDIITLFAAQQWSADIALPLLNKLKGKKVFVPTGFSYLHNPAYQAYYQSMKLWVKNFDAGVFLSDIYQDTLFCKEAGIKHPVLIPNGASADEFDAEEASSFRKQHNIPQDEFLVLHVGGFTGVKGHLEAIKIFLKSKLKNASLLLIGNGNARFAHLLKTHPRLLPLHFRKIITGKKIRIIELNRKETVQAFKNADVFLFPSNIECSPIVLFECMAAGLPFLSSEAGNAAEIVQWTQAGKIIPGLRNEMNWVQPDVNKGARMLEDLYKDQNGRKKMSEAGKKIWKERFTWEKITAQYEQLYLELSREAGV